MKRATLSALFIGLLIGTTFAAGCKPTSTSTSDLAAKVNGTTITMAELDKQFKARTQGPGQSPAPEEVQGLKMQLLNQMINDNILMEMATKAGLAATDSEVDLKFNEFKSQYTEEKFQQLLKEQKMTADEIRAELRKSITIDKLVNKEITSKISVTDAGPGFREEELPRLFDSFFTTKPHGIGLGLSISRSIVERHGGTLTASRTAEGHTRFTLSIPVEARE